MKTRKGLALLLTLAITLVTGGMTIHAAKDTGWNSEEIWSPDVMRPVGLPFEIIESTLEEIKDAVTGTTITVEMGVGVAGGVATVMPHEILEAAKGKDIEVSLHMGEYSWNVAGTDITAKDLKDINLKVTLDTHKIPGPVIQLLAGEKAVKQISLAHEGEFGFKATLTISVGSENTGKYGNLYYYNKSGKLEFIGSGKISAGGDLNLPFTHASDYVVVMSDQQMSQEDVPQELAPEDQEPSGSTSTEAPTITVTEFPTEPVKPGDTVKYTIQVDPKGADMKDWFLVVQDFLKKKIEGKDSYDEIPLTGTTVEVSYEIPKNEFLGSSIYPLNLILADGVDPDWGTYHELAWEYGYSIPAQPTLEGKVEFQTKNLVTGKEYPFSLTLSNTADFAVEDFSVYIWCEAWLNGNAAYLDGQAPTFKVTRCPEGAVVNQESDSVTVENMTVPVGGTISISGTVKFPTESSATQLHFVQQINGKEVSRIGTTGFPVAVPSGNGGAGNKKPDKGNSGNSNSDKTQTSENSEKVLTDSASGITVSGAEAGVELKVDSAVSQEQRAAIEEKVKRLVGDYKAIAVYDISLWKNNAEYQPGVPVKVTIPIPQGFSRNLKLYHQNKQGELEAVSVEVGNSVVSFEAKNFSPYALVDLGEGTDSSNGTTKDTAPRTADTSSIIPYIMLALASMGIMGAAARRKYGNR